MRCTDLKYIVHMERKKGNYFFNPSEEQQAEILYMLDNWQDCRKELYTVISRLFDITYHQASNAAKNLERKKLDREL